MNQNKAKPVFTSRALAKQGEGFWCLAGLGAFAHPQL
jgi:hypothetical protein